MIEQHLLLTRDRDEWSPRRTSKAGNGTQPGRVNHRLNRQFIRHGGRTLGFAKRIRFQSHVDRGPRRRYRFASSIFQQAPENPLFEYIEILVVEARPIWRHVWLLGVRERFPQFASVYVSGKHDRARPAAAQHSLVAG